ncbi:COPI associated protein [Carex littledalei]|uniref:COPI associated protein n=1 Tax=Carex littledalei TaxID=544730 RepID=A0A833QBT3_9POAL|nr:COPI associated protein [Carex littledalei]
MSTEEEFGETSLPPSVRVPSPPRRNKSDPFLIVCRCFGLVTAIIALLCVAVNVLSAYRCFSHGKDIYGGIFRCYAVLIAFLVAVAETEWSFITKFSKVLEYWAGRGMLQIFVAVMTRAYPNVERQDLILLQEISSYLLLGCGLIYIISGVLCIQFLKQRREKKEVSREQAVKDLEELEKRREELEALLLEESV